MELVENLQDIILDILKEEFSDTRRHRVRNLGSEFRFSCPVCGDSHNIRKTRGTLYLDTMKYYCYNGECTAKYWDVFKFLKTYGKSVGNVEHIKEIGERLKTLKLSRTRSTVQSSGKYFKFLNDNSIPLDKIIEHYGLSDYKSFNFSKKFINRRLLNHCTSNFLFKDTKYGGQVWIVNKIGKNAIGLQIKHMNTGDYTTKDFSTINDDMGIEVEYPENFKSYCDNLSLIFNIFNVNLERNINVFEGPIDSFFMRNSVATSGASKLREFFDDMENIRFFYDNDTTGKKYAIEKAKIGKPVFMWKKFINDHNIKSRKDIKDLNELFTFVNDNRQYTESLSSLDKYFTKHKLEFYHV